MTPMSLNKCDHQQAIVNEKDETNVVKNLTNHLNHEKKEKNGGCWINALTLCVTIKSFAVVLKH